MSQDWRSNVLCRYFMNGSCRYGEQCLYSHDPSLQRPRLPCKFYQRGTCAYGSRCQYLHGSASSTADTATGTTTTAPATAPAGAAASSSVTDRVTATSTTSSHQGMVRLSPCRVSQSRVPNNWANAAEFVPAAARKQAPTGQSTDQTRTFSELFKSDSQVAAAATGDQVIDPSLLPLCPYAAVGECRYGDTCGMLHGLVCDYCQCAVLHPHDGQQRSRHETECAASFEQDMEHSFRVAGSVGKTCGICMEVVLEKSGSSTAQRFGILPNCNHCFCVSCIREWRGRDEFEARVTRGCPECRVHSDFVCPSRYWIDQPDQKKQLIDSYVLSCSKKPCRHFDEGRGECPFGDKCFYSHKYPDGRRAKLGPPRRRVRHNDLLQSVLMRDILLSDFLDEDDASDEAASGRRLLFGGLDSGEMWALNDRMVRLITGSASANDDDEDEDDDDDDQDDDDDPYGPLL